MHLAGSATWKFLRARSVDVTHHIVGADHRLRHRPVDPRRAAHAAPLPHVRQHVLYWRLLLLLLLLLLMQVLLLQVLLLLQRDAAVHVWAHGLRTSNPSLLSVCPRLSADEALETACAPTLLADLDRAHLANDETAKAVASAGHQVLTHRQLESVMDGDDCGWVLIAGTLKPPRPGSPPAMLLRNPCACDWPSAEYRHEPPTPPAALKPPPLWTTRPLAPPPTTLPPLTMKLLGALPRRLSSAEALPRTLSGCPSM